MQSRSVRSRTQFFNICKGLKTFVFLLFAAGASLAGPSLAEDAKPDVVAIAEMIDMTSFPNSIGPKREPGKITLRDYGFVLSERDADKLTFITLENNWAIYIELLSFADSKATICFTDEAMNGGSYFTVDTNVFKQDADGFYRSTGERPIHSGCMPKRSKREYAPESAS